MLANSTPTEKEIRIARDFTRYPAGRYHSDGPYSGEAFRESYLKPILEANEKAIIVFDGAMGYGSSFLEEAFAGLVREGYSKQRIMDTFQFVSKEDPSIIDEIEEYLTDAESQ